jgi:Right handed beta helix region
MRVRATKRCLNFSRLAAVLLAFGIVFSHIASGAEFTFGPLELVPTFESIGATLSVTESLDDLSIELFYRVAGTVEWQRALTPVACPAEREFRGSILLLAPATSYEIKARVSKAGAVLAEAATETRTWTDDVPIAREIVLQAGTSDRPLVIADCGTPEGWIRYRAATEGSAVDAGTKAPSAVVLDHAAYVIVEGLVIRGGSEHAVQVIDSHDVRIRDCDISGWGDPGTWRYYEDKKRKQWAYLDAAGKIIDRQAGIRVRGSGSTRVVLERNLIHHPRGTAACWAFTHPHGPSGIVLSETGGNNVVRGNDLVAGDGHRWNDAIESEYNGEVIGGPYRDTDIYGNFLAGANDDGTELDGGQMNVRYWYNWIEGGLCGVSCAPNLRGPSYVFRNLIVTGDERGASGAGFKMGGDPGLTFLLNNTIYTGAYGLTSGHYGKNPTPIFSRNNLFTGPAVGQGRVRFDRNVAGDLDRDLIPVDGLVGTEARSPGREEEAIFAQPKFVGADARDFRLITGSAGAKASVAVAGIAGKGTDFGAFADGAALTAWPSRPKAPQIFPGRGAVRLNAGARTEIELNILSTVAGMRWRAVAGESWLSCALPAVSSGERQRLVVHVDAHALSVGTHRTFVSVRTAGGSLRTIPLEIEVAPAMPVTRVFQPEQAVSAAGFEIVHAADAHGGGFVRTVSATQTKPLTFTFDLAEAGRFFVHARVKASGPAAKIASQDSLTLQIDDGEVMAWDLFGLSDGAWTWTRATPKENISGGFTLVSGSHHIRVGMREPLVEWDEILISNSPFAP